MFIGSHAIAEGAVTAKQLKSGSTGGCYADVYVDPGIPLDHELVARGAALVMPEDAVLGGRSAAAWFGARSPRLSIPFSSSFLRAPHGEARAGSACIGAPSTAEDVVTVDDGAVRLTSP